MKRKAHSGPHEAPVLQSEKLYSELFDIVPDACLFTIVEAVPKSSTTDQRAQHDQCGDEQSEGHTLEVQQCGPGREQLSGENEQHNEDNEQQSGENEQKYSGQSSQLDGPKFVGQEEQQFKEIVQQALESCPIDCGESNSNSLPLPLPRNSPLILMRLMPLVLLNSYFTP